jgi:Haem-binding domain/Cytochrome P460
VFENTIMKRVWVVILVLLAIFVALQFFRPSLDNPPVTGDLKAPPEVKAVLERACYDCHSNQTQLRWFDEVVPPYWSVVKDVKDGRAAMNFSNWDSLSKFQQMFNLFGSVFMIEQKAMPLPSYTYLHHGGVITSEELAELKQYVAPLGFGYHLVLDTAGQREADAEYGNWKQATGLAVAKDEPNGIRYGELANYRNWQVLSTNKRFDLGEFHMILGNPIAVKAIREGQTNPYPDGAILAKPAWQQLLDSSGKVRSGAFMRVEFMIRDSKKYASTLGWGWARWIGTTLTPWGTDAASVAPSCVSCHRPLEKTNYVFTLPYADSLRVGVAVGSQPDSLAFPLRGKVVTVFADAAKGTVSTLYSGGPVAAGRDYAAGTVLSLVTWTLQDDARWFGGAIPQTVQTVEQVRIGADGKPEYAAYSGLGLTKKDVAADIAEQRVRYILDKKAAVMP